MEKKAYKMIQGDFDDTKRYSMFLEGTHYGKTQDERLRTATEKFNTRCNEIEKAKERQMKWLIAIHLFALVSLFAPYSGVIAAFLMNIAAYNYGKFHFMHDAETLAYKDAVEKLGKSK